ncbi:DNA polymerase III subunit epsilon, partial [Vibrio alginolyticus]|nr:DNA polymerase III subunit epsilon [Vibrio alginolyticus]
DAEILADVYLAMTGGQTCLPFSMDADTSNESYVEEVQRIDRPVSGLRVLYATDEELIEHEKRLDIVDKKGGKPCLWRQSPEEG